MKSPRTCLALVCSLGLLLPVGTAGAGSADPDEAWNKLQEQLPGKWLRGRAPDGRTRWLVGSGLAAPDGVELPKPPQDASSHAGKSGKEAKVSEGGDPTIGLSRIPRVTDQTRIPIEIDFHSSVVAESVQVLLGRTDVTSEFDIRSSGAKSRAPLALEPGRNILTVEARAPKGGDARVHIAIEVVDQKKLEALAASRRLIELASPVLGLDLDKVDLRFGGLEEDLILEHGDDAGKGALRLARARWVPTVQGVAVDGAGLNVLLFPDPESGRPVAGALLNGIGALPAPDASLQGLLSPGAARDAIANQVADGDTASVTTPVLYWVSGPDNEVAPGYVAFLSDAYRGEKLSSLPGSERIVADARHGKIIARADLSNTTQVREVIDGPPEDLDSSFLARPLRGMDVFLTLDGPVWCGNGPHARFYNNSEHSSGYTRPCLPDDLTPDLFPTPDDIIEPTSLQDELLDGFGAYYHVDEIARFLSSEIGYDHDFAGNNFWMEAPLSYSTQLPLFVNESVGIYRDNAVALTILVDAGVYVVDMVALAFGQGSGFGPTTFGAEEWQMRAGFARDRDVVYHEFAHSVLTGIGFLSFNELKASLHEGFADYTSHSITGADVIPGDWLVESNGLPGSVQRACGVFDPDDDGFQAYPADDPDDDVGDPHIAGAAFCQALARAQLRSELIDGADSTDTLGLAAFSSADWFPAQTQLEPVASSLLSREVVRWIVLRLFGHDTVPRDHEIRTALALHGIVEDTAGRTSAISLEQGGRTFYGPSSDTSFLIATGVNPFATLEFSLDSNFSTVCHSEEITLADAGPNRFFEGAFDFDELRADCLSPWAVNDQIVHVNLVSCTGDSDCRDSSAANLRELGGTPLWIEVQSLVSIAPL